MTPDDLTLSIVAGTAGTFAVAYSPPRGDWLIYRVAHRPCGRPAWLWLNSSATEDGARKFACVLYARELAREATR